MCVDRRAKTVCFWSSVHTYTPGFSRKILTLCQFIAVCLRLNSTQITLSHFVKFNNFPPLHITADLLSKVFACLDFFRITFFVLRVWEFFPQSLTPGQDNKQWGELRKEKHLERKCYPDSAKSTLKCIFNLVELFRKIDWKIKTINASTKLITTVALYHFFLHSVWNNLVFLWWRHLPKHFSISKVQFNQVLKADFF